MMFFTVNNKFSNDYKSNLASKHPIYAQKTHQRYYAYNFVPLSEVLSIQISVDELKKLKYRIQYEVEEYSGPKLLLLLCICSYENKYSFFLIFNSFINNQSSTAFLKFVVKLLVVYRSWFISRRKIQNRKSVNKWQN